MTPAERVAKNKPHRNGQPSRTVYWKCRLREMRDALGLSMRDIEKATGIASSTLCHTEHGCDPTLTTAMTLAKFFGKSIEYLWPERV